MSKKIISFLSCKWLSDFLYDILFYKLEQKGKTGKVLVNIIIGLGFIIISFGMMLIIRLVMGLAVSFPNFLVPIYIILIAFYCFFHKQPWLWTINFIAGIFCIFHMLN